MALKSGFDASGRSSSPRSRTPLRQTAVTHTTGDCGGSIRGRVACRWAFDESDWWLEEHGLIMEAPEFPLAAGDYLVTGDRDAVSVLTVHAAGHDGRQNWELSEGANIYDVTHLRCRSARYTSASAPMTCSPTLARQSDFPVSPGAVMPPVSDCSKQDYAVLLVIGRPAGS